ncbi:GIY-YIG nuclease family protein [Tatumella citrea]|uniref:Excinuclease ABC subunit A n=1 Tax=Tatumella citrea TaxID=53336 RepID=A0A1Y0L4D3_TATCI|nr:GIY-YIG nuclease family protein [Tatumella citrea]ARU92558.1 excinuclease ABC subunit A [Tatumella citrea]ARU96593.1 excinuclease ABC subunit A [Tatumella citrea]
MQTEDCWFLYIVRTASGALYTGITTDVARRFLQHQRGTGAKALRGKGPLTLVFQCPAGDRSRASVLEYRLKQRPRADKLLLVEQQPDNLSLWLTDQP